MRIRTGLLACGLAVSLTLTWRQPAAAQEPTAPEVLVRPENEPVAPVTNVIAPANRALANPFDTPAYPALRTQTFEGLDSASRTTKSLFDIPSMGTVVDHQAMTEKMPQDMTQAIQQEVGVLVQQTARGQASPFVRGLTGQQVLILIDGVRLNNSTFRSGANQYFNTIDPGQVERIEFLRGPGSVAYGSDAIGGVINVVTRSASQLRGNYAGGQFVEYFSTADAGSYTRTNFEGWSGQTGVFAGASYLNVNDLDRGGNLGVQPFTSYDQYAGDVKIDGLLGDNEMLTFALQHFEQENLPRSDRFPPFVFGPPAGTPRPTFFNPQQRDLAYLKLQGLDQGGLIDAYMVTASYARQKEAAQETFTATRIDEGEFNVDQLGLSVILATDLDWAGRLTYGTDYFHEDIDSTKVRRNPVTQAVTPAVPQFPDDSFYERVGVFMNWDVQVTERWNVIAGVRYENIDLGSTPVIVVDPPGAPPPVNVPTPISPSFQDWIGNVGLVYEVNDFVHLVGSISEGFRAPNLDDLVATNTLRQQTGQDIPSVSLTPEHSINYEIGAKLDASRLRGQAFVFWTDLEDNIVRTPGPAAGLFQRSNRDSYLNGVEWAGEYLLTSNWSTYGNFAYTYGVNLVDDTPLSRIPPTQGNIGFRWRSENRRTWLDLYTYMARKQDRLNFQDFTDARIPVGGTPGFQTLNFRTGVTLGERANHQLSMNLQNLFDQAYRVHGSGVDGPGFNAILGYTYLR